MKTAVMVQTVNQDHGVYTHQKLLLSSYVRIKDLSSANFQTFSHNNIRMLVSIVTRSWPITFFTPATLPHSSVPSEEKDAHTLCTQMKRRSVGSLLGIGIGKTSVRHKRQTPNASVSLMTVRTASTLCMISLPHATSVCQAETRHMCALWVAQTYKNQSRWGCKRV